jgi:hypothetical protein
MAALVVAAHNRNRLADTPPHAFLGHRHHRQTAWDA